MMSHVLGPEVSVPRYRCYNFLDPREGEATRLQNHLLAVTFQHDERYGCGPGIPRSARIVTSVPLCYTGHCQLARRLQISLFRVNADSSSFRLQREQQS
jgi:hypothetical protein